MVSLVTGHAFGDTTIVEKLGSALIEVGALSAVIAGGGGTFRVFRKELADRSVASLVLASRPSMIVLAAMIYGVASGVIALVLALLTAGAVTFSSAFPLPMFLYGCFAIIVATAAAIAACSISPDPAVLVPSLIIMLPLSVSIEMQKMPAMTPRCDPTAGTPTLVTMRSAVYPCRGQSTQKWALRAHWGARTRGGVGRGRGLWWARAVRARNAVNRASNGLMVKSQHWAI